MPAADQAVFPTMVFIDYIMPRVYGWSTYLDDKPKLKVRTQKEANVSAIAVHFVR